ncbi:pyruvate/2-oxoglutarate dehydrogenase complex dihydrolipoamide dehydrogenase (E3) component [Ereboglobus sp. PH5-10]|uniref:dihydrolipoyl dehydrogenase family protein n=1 Tax=Ereboglobus sp. PH5-10 TaxID=2940629 RepID=UPI002404B76A|nr:NAD(P)/FAD-dependent oxidoreductase [Ereboglobus sp. PH5-10]MDF9826356.1 pyruvate/2-oxoglutarate dehydrogenase complex dihydrolipoamide dehydrogenase (E3) component [Ereboglobus sp. PH5-10]
MPTKPYDLLVLGGGSAGFNAARVARDEFGKRVAIVDGARELGGLCILRGCMPSKTLLWMTEVLHLAQKGKTFGLHIPVARPDIRAMHARKKKIIAEFADYRARAMNSGKYDLYRANARFIDPHTVELNDDKRTRLSAKKILIATGSRVSTPPIHGLADTPHWTSDDVLDLNFIPKSVIVLGGGIIAVELTQYLRRLGVRVTLIQRSPNILRDHSPEASAVIQQALRDEGVELFTHTRIEKIARTKRGVRVTFAHTRNGTTKSVAREAAHLFNALGREPNTAGLNLAAAGVRLTPAGRIRANRHQQTTAPHIYAGGDVCGPNDIVHLAIAQGELAARHAFLPSTRPPRIPAILSPTHLLNVVFTDPALATIGLLESQLRAKKIPFIAASYPYNDHGKTILMDANAGYVKVLADPKRGRILGAEIVGRDAGELIHIFSTPLVMRATVHDMLRAPWYHPTIAEIITYPLEELAEKTNQ